MERSHDKAFPRGVDSRISNSELKGQIGLREYVESERAMFEGELATIWRALTSRFCGTRRCGGAVRTPR